MTNSTKSNMEYDSVGNYVSEFIQIIKAMQPECKRHLWWKIHPDSIEYCKRCKVLRT